jgi:hypothetical protein
LVQTSIANVSTDSCQSVEDRQQSYLVIFIFIILREDEKKTNGRGSGINCPFYPSALVPPKINNAIATIARGQVILRFFFFFLHV